MWLCVLTCVSIHVTVFPQKPSLSHGFQAEPSWHITMFLQDSDSHGSCNIEDARAPMACAVCTMPSLLLMRLIYQSPGLWYRGTELEHRLPA